MATSAAQVGALLKAVIAKGIESKDAVPTIKILIEAKIFSLEDLTSTNVPAALDPKVQQKLLRSNKRGTTNGESSSPSKRCKKSKTKGGDDDDTSLIAQPPIGNHPPDAKILVNRSPVLTLWAAIVAMELYTELSLPEALSIGSAVAAHTAHGKGTSLGIYVKGEEHDGVPSTKSEGINREVLEFSVLGVNVSAHRMRGCKDSQSAPKEDGKFADGYTPTCRVDQGIRAIQKQPPGAMTKKGIHFDKYHSPQSTWNRLQDRFKASLGLVMAKMRAAATAAGSELESTAYRYYMHVRPDIPPGAKGWGAYGALDLNKLDEFYSR